MRNLLRVIILLTSTITFFSSCKHDCYRDLNTEEIRRLGYAGENLLIFRSNTGLVDSATLSNPILHKEAKEKDCKKEKYYYETAGNFKRRFYDSTILGLPLFIYIYTPDAKSKDFVYPEISFYGGYKFDESLKGWQTINGQQYANVYELINQEPGYKCAKIYFSLERGLLKVVNKDGTYWERINL